MQVNRLLDRPIITPDMDERIGTNINGPSLIRVPEWLPNPLGRFYLYFAHHQGGYIRLAYAEEVTGPWAIYTPGTLHLDQTCCHGHIASPDVHVDEANQRLIMYFHGPYLTQDEIARDSLAQRHPVTGGQRSFVATSTNGINFRPSHEVLGSSYFRVFEWRGMTYALGMPGIFFRSRDGLSNFKKGPTLFKDNMRHAALLLRNDRLYVFCTEAGACPEHILVSQIELDTEWMEWSASDPMSLLFPEKDYEGGNLPLKPSARGAIHEPVHQLRDPSVFEEKGRTFLLYSVAGEQGIALAELTRFDD